MKKDSKSKCGFTLMEVMIIVAIIGLLAAILIPYLARATEIAKANACQMHLRQIEKAKVEWSQRHVSVSGIPPVEEIKAILLKENGHLPVCPLDTKGTFESSYSINAIGTVAVCLIAATNADPELAHVPKKE